MNKTLVLREFSYYSAFAPLCANLEIARTYLKTAFRSCIFTYTQTPLTDGFKMLFVTKTKNQHELLSGNVPEEVSKNGSGLFSSFRCKIRILSKAEQKLADSFVTACSRLGIQLFESTQTLGETTIDLAILLQKTQLAQLESYALIRSIRGRKILYLDQKKIDKILIRTSTTAYGDLSKMDRASLN